MQIELESVRDGEDDSGYRGRTDWAVSFTSLAAVLDAVPGLRLLCLPRILARKGGVACTFGCELLEKAENRPLQAACWVQL